LSPKRWNRSWSWWYSTRAGRGSPPF
jgi:hypothetical protein